jgi:hypothetical protein
MFELGGVYGVGADTPALIGAACGVNLLTSCVEPTVLPGICPTMGFVWIPVVGNIESVTDPEVVPDMLNFSLIGFAIVWVGPALAVFMLPVNGFFGAAVNIFARAPVGLDVPNPPMPGIAPTKPR